VIFQNFRHQAVYAASYIGQQHQDICAVISGGQGTLNRIHLPTDPLDPGNQFLLFLHKMRHFSELYPRGICYKNRGDASSVVGSVRKPMNIAALPEPPAMAGVLSRCDYVGPPISTSLIDYLLASHSARRVRVSEQSRLNERFYPPLLSLFVRRSVPEADRQSPSRV
jgi:hypothetical protein